MPQKVINEKSLLEFLVAYFVSIGCDETEVRSFLTGKRFTEALVLCLPAVCLVTANKPDSSSSKQSHIHITSKARKFFYDKDEIEDCSESSPWTKFSLIISKANVDCLNNIGSATHLDIASSFAMKKIEVRKKGEKQVQLSKLKEDDALFKNLRKGLYEHDLLIFLKQPASEDLFAVGIPYSFYANSYFFEDGEKKFKMGTFSGLESRNAIPLKTVMQDIAELHEEEEVIENDDAVSDAVYQSLVDAAEPSETDYVPEPYVPSSSPQTANNRIKTNPALGKEAINDASYLCSVDSEHTTFLKPNGKKYMEAHHLIPVKMQHRFTNKLDVKANIVPLCPHCHALLHYGRIEEIKPILRKLYEQRKDLLKRSGLDITFEELLDMYR